jgi:hypothetical protein
LVAIVILLVLTLPGAPIAAKPHDDDASHFALYASTDEGREYRPLDPMTLQDMSGAEALTFAHDWPQVVISADGSTFVSIDTSQRPLEDWIVVRDGVGGPERLAITVKEAVYNPRLSADGSRLVVEPTLMCGPTGCGERTWYTYDTRSGDLVSTIQADLGDTIWPDLLAPGGERLYLPFHERPAVRTTTTTPEPGEISDIGPWLLQIAAYDLETGQELARMMAPAVFAGSWQVESIDQMYVGEMELPGIALSPDGSRIAVVDAAMEQLTLIDAATLEVVETHAIHAPEGAVDCLLRWLGATPQTAQAKVSQGRSVRATFSADGQHLYLTGHEMEVGDTIEEITGHGLGLLQIDVKSGRITAETLVGHDAETIIPAPDEGSVYVVRPEEPWWDNPSSTPNYVLQRLDAETLAPLAERPYTAWPQIVLAPMVSTQASQ